MLTWKWNLNHDDDYDIFISLNIKTYGNENIIYSQSINIGEDFKLLNLKNMKSM